MKEAMTRHADEAHNELPDEHHRKICERMFKSITERGNDGRGIRRPLPFSDLVEIVGVDEQALMKAATDGQTAEVRVLLAAGTDPDAVDKRGNTALLYAANRGHEEAVGALAEGGADLDKANMYGGTPLMVAASNGHSGVVRRLLELGADHTAVGTGGPYEGKTALEAAEERGKEEAAAVLRAWAASHPHAEYDARVAACRAPRARASSTWCGAARRTPSRSAASRPRRRCTPASRPRSRRGAARARCGP